MKEIQLNDGLSMMVDDEDYLGLSSMKWRAYRNENVFYARISVRVNGKKTTRAAHSFIMGRSADNLYIDHIDGNGLNNQRSNLRFCSVSQNAMNARPIENGTSKYKGVYWVPPNRKWRSKIMAGGKRLHLGMFSNEIEAARAYDSAAIKYFGEFARINFPQ